MNARNKRLLKELVDEKQVMVRDLRFRVGALNVAQNALSLRRCGWNIKTGYVQVVDRDGRRCRPGYYWFEDQERERARCFLEEAGAGATALPAADEDIGPSCLDYSRGGGK